MAPAPHNSRSTAAALSPQVLTMATPSMVNRPSSSVAESQVPVISINKTWILPPKPKPGRKPAADIPPTKRKAQNREAQRAFRERRAAKVGELEEEMKRMEEEDTKEHEKLKQRIEQLERNLENHSQMLKSWQERYYQMQNACGRERQLRLGAESEILMLRKGIATGTEAVTLPPRRSGRNEHIDEQPPKNGMGDDAVELPLGCGRCDNNMHCQCVEEAIEMSDLADDASPAAAKRPHSPLSSTDNKRQQVSTFASEIDFTAQFASRPPPTLSNSTPTSSLPTTAPVDPCGFCDANTPCLCAELAKGIQPSRPLGPQATFQATLKPLPPSITTSTDPCVNGPGTCSQCRSNPASKLFCTTVAATRLSTSNITKSSKTESTTINPSKPHPSSREAITGTIWSCADTFNTLSQHPAFPRASADMTSWVPQLATVPKPASAPERTAFDIEAASVMSVLQLFDRRFGRESSVRKERKGTGQIAYGEGGEAEKVA